MIKRKPPELMPSFSCKKSHEEKKGRLLSVEKKGSPYIRSQKERKKATNCLARGGKNITPPHAKRGKEFYGRDIQSANPLLFMPEACYREPIVKEGILFSSQSGRRS